MSVSSAIRNPRSFIGEQWAMYRALLLDPGRFFEDYVGKTGIRNEILVVLVVGLAGTVGSFWAVETILGPFSESTIGATGPTLPSDVGRRLWGQIFRPLVGAPVLWVLLTAGFYGISWFYSDLGSAFGMLKRTAWTMVPLVFGNLVMAVATVVATLDFQVEGANGQPVTEGGEVPTGTTEVVFNFLWEQIAGEPLVVAGSVVSLAFVAWIAYIGGYAIADLRDIEVSRATQIAAVPVGIYAVYRLYGIATVVGLL